MVVQFADLPASSTKPTTGKKEKRVGKNVDKITPVNRSPMVREIRKKMQSGPRTSGRAVATLTLAQRSKPKHGDLVKEARSIQFKKLGITDLRCLRAVTW